MACEVVKAKFRTELHARWSIFFDHLRIPWAYEPVPIRARTGGVAIALSPCHLRLGYAVGVHGSPVERKTPLAVTWYLTPES